MRAILVDPVDRKISVVECGPSYRDILKLIEAPIMTVVCLGSGVEGMNEDVMYLDDEGLYRLDQHYFKWRGYHHYLGGKGLVLGGDQMGESVSTAMTLEHAITHVTWMPGLQFVGVSTTNGEIDHPILGRAHQVVAEASFSGVSDGVPASKGDVK